MGRLVDRYDPCITTPRLKGTHVDEFWTGSVSWAGSPVGCIGGAEVKNKPLIFTGYRLNEMFD